MRHVTVERCRELAVADQGSKRTGLVICRIVFVPAMALVNPAVFVLPPAEIFSRRTIDCVLHSIGVRWGRNAPRKTKTDLIVREPVTHLDAVHVNPSKTSCISRILNPVVGPS